MRTGLQVAENGEAAIYTSGGIDGDQLAYAFNRTPATPPPEQPIWPIKILTPCFSPVFWRSQRDKMFSIMPIYSYSLELA